MGIGNFFGMLPPEMQSSRLYGVELDSITGRIAQKLYPNAEIKVAGFETTDRRDFYDLAVGNVPFGNYKVSDKPYDKLGFSIHNYFFAKALDQVRPGGVVAFVTSRYTMDSKNSDARRYMAQRAELLGAIRLPNDAFKKMAGLNFVGNAVYAAIKPDVENIAQFEFIPWILSQCSSLVEVRELLERINIVNTPFSEQLPLAQLHWIISDENESITVESMSDGLHIYDNPVGVLTNNPPFPQQMFQLNNYMYLSPKQPRNTFCENLALDAYSRGMGGLGLPGDLSSSSRFVRVAFTKVNAISGESEEESVSQFFHILGSVDQQRGCCEVADGKYEITLYTSCCNVTKGIYYYNTYENHQISAVDMHVENLDSDKMICYPVIQGERINYQNK